MIRSVSWVALIVGTLMLLSGVGYFVAVLVNFGDFVLSQDYGAVIQIFIAIALIVFGFKYKNTSHRSLS